MKTLNTFLQKRLIFTIVILCLLLTACAGMIARDPESLLKPWDKAQVYAMRSAKIVQAAYQRAVLVEKTGTPEQISFYRMKVNPAINVAKKAVADYLDLTVVWERLAVSGIDEQKPQDLIQLELQVEALLLKLVDMISSYD